MKSFILTALLVAVPAFSYPSRSNSYASRGSNQDTYQTIPTKYVSINGTNLAYRRFGHPREFPLVYFNHLRGSMDVLDPLFFNTVAKNREVIVFDSFGVGHSEGQVANTVEQMGEIGVAFLESLGLTKVDLLGFSLGGMATQYIAIQYPELLNKLVLAGTQPSGSNPVVLTDRSIIQRATTTPNITAENLVPLFFSSSKTSTDLGMAWFKRFDERHVEGEENKGFLTGSGVAAQAAAMNNWVSSSKWFDRLGEIQAPVLVTNGHTDLMTPTPNSFLLQQNITNALLHLYPDSGHGHLFQYSESYAIQLELFLNA